MSMNFNWNFAQPTNGQAAFDAAQAALQNKRNNAYTQNMGNRQVGNANDMMSWMQQGNDAAAYQQEQALAAEQQAAAAEQQAQQEAAQKQAQIDSIKSRISELESQITANQAKLKNWEGVGGQVAALEARKINAQDPTSIWRWKAGMDAQKTQRAEDLARIEAEKQKTEKRNKELNQYKVESILKSTMPSNARTRDELTMMDKNLNDAEELAKQYGDTDMLKRIDNRRQVLRNHIPVSEKSNEIESDFIKEMSMVGKVGGRTKAQFVEYVNDILEKNPDVWRYNPALQQKLYQSIGSNTKNTPKPKAPQE